MNAAARTVVAGSFFHNAGGGGSKAGINSKQEREELAIRFY